MPRTLKAQVNSRSLTMQFLLSEMMLAFQLLWKIEKITHDSIPLKPKRKKALAEMLMKLAGTNHGLFGWNSSDGNITKIKNYSIVLSKYAPDEDERHASLRKHTNSAWMYAQKALDLLKSMKQDDLDFLPVTIEKSYSSMKRASKHFRKILLQHQKDENLLLFILLHCSKLEKLFGPDFPKRLMQDTYCSVPEAEQFIRKKYTSRGFEFLMPLIEKSLAPFNV